MPRRPPKKKQAQEKNDKLAHGLHMVVTHQTGMRTQTPRCSWCVRVCAARVWWEEERARRLPPPNAAHICAHASCVLHSEALTCAARWQQRPQSGWWLSGRRSPTRASAAPPLQQT